MLFYCFEAVYPFPSSCCLKRGVTTDRQLLERISDYSIFRTLQNNPLKFYTCRWGTQLDGKQHGIFPCIRIAALRVCQLLY